MGKNGLDSGPGIKLIKIQHSNGAEERVMNDVLNPEFDNIPVRYLQRFIKLWQPGLPKWPKSHWDGTIHVPVTFDVQGLSQFYPQYTYETGDQEFRTLINESLHRVSLGMKKVKFEFHVKDSIDFISERGIVVTLCHGLGDIKTLGQYHSNYFSNGNLDHVFLHKNTNFVVNLICIHPDGYNRYRSELHGDIIIYATIHELMHVLVGNDDFTPATDPYNISKSLYPKLLDIFTRDPNGRCQSTIPYISENITKSAFCCRELSAYENACSIGLLSAPGTFDERLAELVYLNHIHKETRLFIIDKNVSGVFLHSFIMAYLSNLQNRHRFISERQIQIFGDIFFGTNLLLVLNKDMTYIGAIMLLNSIKYLPANFFDNISKKFNISKPVIDLLKNPTSAFFLFNTISLAANLATYNWNRYQEQDTEDQYSQIHIQVVTLYSTILASLVANYLGQQLAQSSVGKKVSSVVETGVNRIRSGFNFLYQAISCRAVAETNIKGEINHSKIQ